MKNCLQIISVILIVFFHSCSKDEIDSVKVTNVRLKSTSFTETEPNNSLSQANGPVTTGMTISGVISTSSDRDWYKVNCERNRSMIFSYTSPGYYTGANLYDQNGNLIDPIYQNVDYLFTPTYTGYFYIMASAQYGGTAYTINIINEIQESESNNTMASANGPLYSGLIFKGLSDFNNKDYAKIIIPTTTSISFYLTGSDKYISATLMNSSGTALYSINPNQELVYTNLTAGTYYVGISGPSGIPYSFYINPKFSQVNAPLYFDVTGKSGIASRYICSQNSFSNNSVYSIDDNGYGPFHFNCYANSFLGVHYDTPPYNWYGGYYIGGFYDNGFPKIYGQVFQDIDFE